MERFYRQTTLLIVAVAVSAQPCAAPTSTRSFRAQLRADGVDLTGQPRRGVVQKFMTQPLALVQGLAASALAVLSC